MIVNNCSNRFIIIIPCLLQFTNALRDRKQCLRISHWHRKRM